MRRREGAGCKIKLRSRVEWKQFRIESDLPPPYRPLALCATPIHSSCRTRYTLPNILLEFCNWRHCFSKKKHVTGISGISTKVSVHCIHPLHIIQWRIYIIQLWTHPPPLPRTPPPTVQFSSFPCSLRKLWRNNKLATPPPGKSRSASVTDQIPLEDRFFLAD